jgi:MFS family permease
MEKYSFTFFHNSPTIKKAWPWIVCLSAGLFFFYDFMLMNMFNSINSDISKAFNLNATQISWLSGLYPMATVAFLIISGLLLDRFSTRKIILTAMFICLISTSGFALSQNIFQAGFFRFAAGSTAAFCFLSCVMLASRWFAKDHLALITGLIVTMAMTGGSLSQAPLKALVTTYGWKNAMFSLSLFGLVLWCIMFILIHDTPTQKTWRHPASKPTMSIKNSLIKTIKNPQNWILGAYTSLMNLVICVFGGLWGQSFVSSVYNMNDLVASEITMMIFLGTTIGSPLAGWLSDKMGKRKTPMIMGAIFSILLSLILMNLTDPSSIVLEVLFFLLGLFTSTQVISYPAIFESNPKNLTGTAESFSATIIMSGVALFPLFYGTLLDWHGHTLYTAKDHWFAYQILPLSLILSFVLTLFIKETHCKPRHS